MVGSPVPSQNGESILQRILRYLLPLALLVASLALVACGDDDSSGGGGDTGGQPVSSDADVNDILDKTFSSQDRNIKSGKFALNVEANISGDATVSGPVKLSLSGPFESQGD